MGQLNVNVEVSARHVHLSQEDVERLFGRGYELTVKKEMVGGFVAAERLTIVGPKRSMEHIAILGPSKKVTQIELSATDARTLGINAPIRMSGDLGGTPGIKIVAENGIAIETDKGCMIAQRHIHLTERDAEILGVVNDQRIELKVDTGLGRALTFGDVVCRVSGDLTMVHIDTDEGNAAFIGRGCVGTAIAE